MIEFNRRRRLRAVVLAVSAGLEAHSVDGRVDLGHAENLLDLILRIALGHVDRLATKAAGLGEPLRDQVTDDHH
jgi:hypothetical protein